MRGWWTDYWREVLTVGCAAVYVLLAGVSRWRYVAKPYRAGLSADARELRACADVLKLHDPNDAEIIEAAVASLADMTFKSGLSVVFWSPADEIAAENYLASVTEKLATFIPAEDVNVRLLTLQASLTAQSMVEARPLVDAIEAVRESGWTEAATLPERRALLRRAITIDYYENGSGQYLKVLSKAMWQVVIGVFVLTGAVLALGEPEYALVGALGGTLSRLIASIRDEQSDIVTWTTLTLAPVTGAIAAVGGLLVIDTMQSADLLGSATSSLGFGAGPTSINLGLAFVFGFSERLLDRVAAAVDGHVVSAPS